MDIATFISKYANGASTIVYGVSYGTMVVERLMHLNPSNVTGYVLDSIVTSSGTQADKADISDSDTDTGEVGEHFMDLCEQDKDCGSHFQFTNLLTTLRNTYSSFDTDPNSTCAALILNGTEDKPSDAIRYTLGSLLGDSSLRLLIPPLVYRLNRCDANDVNVLTHYFERKNAPYPWTNSDPHGTSDLILHLVVFSEMWETPTPSYADLMYRFTNASVASDGVFIFLPSFCAYSKEKSPGCDEHGVGNYEADGILYSRDQYWNKTAALPEQASVLLMNGKLDPLTPYKYAESLFKALDTPRKELVAFDYASHALMGATPYADGTKVCAMDLLASYVANNGDLDLLDKSCMSEMPTLDMTATSDTVKYWLGTNDAYDGVASPADGEESVGLQKTR
ncbi:unnamed protein product [Hyaloperonospora brassicae]|nr:unnamed protein product [Hyaloperonospora brassicae]